MTTTDGSPDNVARDGANVGVQGRIVTIHGDVTLTVGQDALPRVKYLAGVDNLRSRNPVMARELIWEAMMGERLVTSEVLFHWLVAMLSDRTVQQFSKGETARLQHFRSRWADAGDDPWADGVRLIYRLLDSVLPSAEADMSLLVKQFYELGEDQRDMVLPHLDLFLTGPLKDEMWQLELEHARSRQHSCDRPGRAWMFFQPIPARVVLPPPRPEWVSPASRLAMRACAGLFALAAGYLGWELLWHRAFVGLLGCIACLAGGAAAAAADLELRSLAERRRLKDTLFLAPSQPAPVPAGDALADRVDKLFRKYFNRYEPDKDQRERWKTDAAGIQRFYRDEIIAMCQGSGIPADSVAWLIRHELRQLRRLWQNGTLYHYRQLLPPPGKVAARRAGLAVSVLGAVWAVIELRADPLAYVIGMAAMLSAAGAWRCWLRAGLERRRYAADVREHARRQEDIAEEFRRWSRRLEVKPKDAEMAAWLECDRTILLSNALDHFHLRRSQLLTHAFLEEPAVAARRARINGGQLRYENYRVRVFLLANDGVRQVQANLGMMKGTCTVRERTSFRYDAIVSVRVLHEARRGQRFELRLTAGEPITVQVRDADPDEARRDNSAEPAEETEEADEGDPALDVASVANTMLVLEGVAAEGRSWFRGREQSLSALGDAGLPLRVE